ncbi:MAG: glycogen synthase GlgA [Clostridia bacterium]|nr:glycogen synthase GlgA [Clostridia bacterium]
MKVLFCASECFPFVKTGGLADVVGSLPKELLKQGCDVRVMIPKYRVIDWSYITAMEHICHYQLPFGDGSVFCGIDSLEYEGVRFYFIDNLAMFGHDGVYTGDEQEGFRYAFFCRAVLDSLPKVDFFPDVIHCNDWQTGLIPALLKMQYANDPDYAKIKTVYTIHNLRFQGLYRWDKISSVLHLDGRYFTPDGLEFYGLLSFMKGGIIYADRITTVSPTYAEEICMEYYGERLDGLLRARKYSLSGILNGIDTHSYDPHTDLALPEHYSVRNPRVKKSIKTALQKELGLAERDVPMLSIVSRLTDQKGLDLIACVLNEILSLDVQFVVVGLGEQRYTDMLRDAQRRHPGAVVLCSVLDEQLARRVYAASDLYLMPSQFEPCGLSQMIAMRYGTIPVVRETGGLKDSVIPYNKYTDEGTGFCFMNYNAHEMLYQIEDAVRYWRNDPEMWNRLVHRAMKEDFSWKASAKKYLALYKNMLGLSARARKKATAEQA